MSPLPYGAWPSPISAADLAASSHPVAGGRVVGDEVWWLELRPAEGGRYAVRRTGADGQPEDLFPAPWNARSRVHEYGGGAWTVTGGDIVFVQFDDQRLYRVTPGGEPRPLTAVPPHPAAERYGELSVIGDAVWCVRERHGDGGPGDVRRDIVAVPLNGSATDDPGAVRSVVAGSHFLSHPVVSPDGTTLAWLAWEHPQMPWDGTELRVADLGPDGAASNVRTLVGSTTESVLQPEWLDDDTLIAASDRTGFWNLYRVAVDGGEPVALAPCDADVGGPMWMLGSRWHTRLDDGHWLFVRTFGTDTLCRLDLASGVVDEIDVAGHTSLALGAVTDGVLLLGTSGARVPSGVRRLDVASGALTDVRLSSSNLPPADVFSPAYATTFDTPDGREAHAVVYPPHHPEHEAPEGELPPYVAMIHGGPTAHVTPTLNLSLAYYTSRGIGVVDVNYGGSTGYGREYRDRLRGQWGLVDVADTVAVLHGLVDAGLADPARLAIEGGSAGGWTVLAALTTTDAFACGVSLFGVAELVQFAEETHDFESRYLDGLIGPLPEARDLYEERAPVNHVDGLSCPVLLQQGLDDPIVPPAQAERFRDALVAKGIPHAYRAYEGESHGFRKAATIIDSRESALSFYGQVLGFDPPDVPRLELWRP